MRRGPPARSEDQRAGSACGGDTEILSRMFCSAACSLVVKARVICSWPAATWAASWSTFCRTAARLSDTALSCCGSEEVTGDTIVAGAVWATAACGANQPSCGYEFAMISLDASP